MFKTLSTNEKSKRHRFDFELGTAHPEWNQGVPAGIWLEFPERARMKTETKTTSFRPGFLTSMARSSVELTTLIERGGD